MRWLDRKVGPLSYSLCPLAFGLATRLNDYGDGGRAAGPDGLSRSVSDVRPSCRPAYKGDVAPNLREVDQAPVADLTTATLRVPNHTSTVMSGACPAVIRTAATTSETQTCSARSSTLPRKYRMVKVSTR
jgi:hypothetical protein